MVDLPTYDPAGTQRTSAVRPLAVDADMFGGAQGRALASAGQQMQRVGASWLQIDEKEREKEDAAKVIDAGSQASSRMRHALYGEGGLLERTGRNAEGITETAAEVSDRIRREISGELSTPAQVEAFNRMWTSYSDSTLNSVAGNEFKQRQAARTSEKTSALANIQADTMAAYNDEEMLRLNINRARATIRANPDGLPDEAIRQLERETVSSLHLSVVQRMALDDPSRALDYYTRNKGAINGVDHAEATKMIGQVARIREVRDFVSEQVNNGPANDIISAVIGAESSGDPSAVSPVGAAGLMQLMPETAREQAVAFGMAHVAAMTDSELQEYWKTPEGQQANVRLGRGYLGRMLNRFSKNGQADLEAALVAYNAGPANAEKWLNSGRDYSVLPKPEETLPYVKKVVGAYRGVDVGAFNTSDEIQKALNGQGRKYFNGDGRAFLKTRLQKQHGSAHIDGMSEDLADRMAAMFNDAPDYVKSGLDVMSGYRSVDRQQQLWQNALKKYGSAAAARKWVAPPGNSQHNHGRAADLGWNGGALRNAPKEVVEWVHQNAASYGLAFPLGNEPWHVETAEARGQAAKRDRPTPGDAADARVRRAFADDETADTSGTVTVIDSPASAADLYTQAQSPFTVEVTGGSLEAALSAARERYADDPSRLAEAERQITNEMTSRTNASKAQVETFKRDLLARLLQNGQSPRDADPSVLSAIGAEGVKQLFSLEDDIKQGGTRITDDATYIELVQMEPDEFRNADLMQYVDKLSRTDLQKFADKQAELRRGNSDAMRGVTQTRTQIMSSAQDILGLQPNKKPDDAKRLAQLNRALDTQIAAYVAREDKQPDGVVLQKMVDDLLIEGKIDRGGVAGFLIGDPSVRMFEVTPEQAADFYAASTVEDIPPEVQGQVATAYYGIYNSTPDETGAVDLYNDMLRIQAGGVPVPPPSFAAQVKQRFAARFGRPPLPDEIASIYKQTLVRATGAQNGNQR